MAYKKLRNKALKHYSDLKSFEKAAILFDGALVTAFSAFFYAYLSYLVDYTPGMYVCIILGLVLCLWPLLFIAGMSTEFIGVAYIMAGCLGDVLCIIYSGGFDSYVLGWMATVPLAALLLIDRKWAGIFLVFSIVFVATLGILDSQGIDLPIMYNPDYEIEFGTFCYLGLIAIIVALSFIFEAEKNDALHVVEERNSMIKAKNTLLSKQSKELREQQGNIQEQKQKSEELLLNILPKDIADELKEKGSSRARSYELASVMFTDFVGFSRLSNSLDPDDLVSLIDLYFRNFDRIITKYQLEKIKTIGDAYLCVGGLGDDLGSQSQSMVAAALEIQETMHALKTKRVKEGKPFFEARVGIHQGALVAGVVGKNKFAYDVWGEAVDLASVMESHCKPGDVNISEEVYATVSQEFNCTYQGNIQTKSNKELGMYSVESLFSTN